MHRSLSRLTLWLLASTVALSAVAIGEPTGQASGHRNHKPLTVTTSSNLCANSAQPTNVASDPEEGGQVNRHALDAANVQPANVASDPEEGGQVTAARTAKPKPRPQVSDINVMKSSDQASAALATAPPPGGNSCP